MESLIFLGGLLVLIACALLAVLIVLSIRPLSWLLHLLIYRRAEHRDVQGRALR